MPQAVVLLHRTPEGGAHFDWLFQRTRGGRLIAFRVPAPPDRAPPWDMSAERLPDHREAYLTYEGPISGGRGEVSRVAQGTCNVLLDRPDTFRATVRFAPIAGELTGRPAGGPHWVLAFRPIPVAAPHADHPPT